MKKLMQVLVVVVLSAVTQIVHAATWTGGGDQTSWGDPNNWEEQHLPSGNTEDAIFAPTSPITVNLGNEIRQIAKLKVSGAKVTFTSGGDNHYLLLTGIEATAPIDMNVPVQSKDNVTYSLVGGSDFRKNIRNWNQWVKLTIKIASGVVNFHGDIEHYEISGGAGVAGSAAGDCAHFYGKLTATWFSWGRFENRSGWCYIHSTGNPVKNVNLAFSTIHSCEANAFSDTTVLNWDGYYRETALKHGSYDFLGNDQTIAHVVANTVYDTKDNFRHLRSSTGDMTLTLKATASATARVDVNEGVSIVYDPQGDYTQEFAAYPSPMTGSITVKGGTFKVSGGATFADASAVMIDAGATFDLSSTADEALRNVPEINLNGTLKVAATATNPFGGGKTTLKIGTGAVEVPSGVNVKVNVAEIGGARIAAKTYKARGSAATGEECDWVTGDGTVQVMTMGETHETRVWTGAADNGLWNDPDNWQGGIVPQSFDTASFPANAAILDDIAIDNDRTIAIAQDCTVQFCGAVSGGAAISCIGNEGILELRGENTFTGDLIISNSIVKAYGENALSSSSLGAIRVIKHGHTAGANLQLSGVRIRKALYNANKDDTANLWKDSILCVAETTNSFEGAFTCTDGHLRMSVDTTAKLTISGGMSISASYFITRKAGAEVVISGTSAGFPVYDNSGSAADAFMTFACGANIIGTFQGLSETRGISDAMRTTVENAFRGDSHCYFGGENAKLDLCGHNQEFGRIMAMSGKPAGVICSQEPATLTLIGNETYSNNAVFQGQVSLAKNGTGTVTLQSASTSSGTLSVGGGTLKIAAGASWAGAQINIANGTALDVTDRHAFGKTTTIAITGTGYINIPAGVTLKCKELTVNGKTETGIFSNNSFVKGGGTLRAGRIGLAITVK